MTLSSAVRSGIIAGIAILFVILIGVYNIFEALTLSGMWLTMQGATANVIAAQTPSLTNPPFSRILIAAIALLIGAAEARGAKSFVEGVVRAIIAGAIAGGVVAAFLLIINTLYANKFDVSFVFEKLKVDAVKGMFFNQPANIGSVLWVGAFAILGIVGAIGYFGWRAANPGRMFARLAGQTPSAAQRVRLALLALAAAALLIVPLFAGVYWNEVLGSIGLFVLLGLGLNIVVGFAGLLDLGYVGFYAIGAYTMAVLTAPDYPFHWSFWAAVPIAMVTAAIAGTLLGIPVLRLRGDYLAIVTLGFGEIIRILFKFNPVTGGPQGILNVASPAIKLSFLNVEFNSSTPFWYLIFFAALIVAFVALRLNDSRLGRSWTAMREDEDAAEATGIDTVRAKLLAFGAGALFAGLGGAIYATRQQHIFPDDFTLLISINALALIIIGGLGSIPGVIIGSIVLIGLPEVLRPVQDYRLLAYAALLVVMMLLRPAGLIPSARRQREFRERNQELETVESS